MKKDINKLMRALPAVDAVLQLPEAKDLLEAHGHEAVTAAVRATIDEIRAAIRKGATTNPDAVAVLAAATARLTQADEPRMKPVINATGIILHTGLGRACMPEVAREALARAAGYCNLQQDLHTGQRDRREENIRELVVGLTGAEDVALVNNNAGATMLVLAALARGREVVVSRGELIEIGGSFRLPDIMRESGAILREVGTTNKTHLKDYENAVGQNTGLLMKAHKSNYKIVGFTKEVGIADIVKVGRKHGVPVVDDVGCGALVGLEAYGLEHEPTVQESLAAGADVVLFSTDKLIGGPQGGMIVGRADLIEKIRSHPLYRVLRVCKLTLAAVEATLKLFKAPDLLPKRHPVYMMLAKTPTEMEAQAVELKKLIAARQPGWKLDVARDVSFLGGGTVPESEMPSVVLRIVADKLSADDLALKLRLARTPVFPRVSDDAVVLDMRTVFAGELATIAGVVGEMRAEK